MATNETIMMFKKLHIAGQGINCVVAVVLVVVSLAGSTACGQIYLEGNHAVSAARIQQWLAETGAQSPSRMAEQLGAHYREAGYYDARVVIDHDSLTSELIARIDEGPAVTLGKIQAQFIADYAGAVDETAINEILSGIASRENIDRGIRRIVEEIAADGYPVVQISPVDFKRQGNTLNFSLEIDPGPPVRVGYWRITGLGRTDTAYIRETLGLATGAIWDRETQTRLKGKIAELEYLRPAAEPRIIEHHADTLVTVEVPLAELPAVVADGGIGLASGRGGEQGLRGSIRLTVDNPFGRGRHLGLVVSRPNERSSESLLEFADPHLITRRLGVSAGLVQSRQNTAYDRFAATVGMTLAVHRRTRLSMELGWTRITPLGGSSGLAPARSYDLSVAAGSLGFQDQPSGTLWQVEITGSLRRTFVNRGTTETVVSSRRYRVSGMAGRAFNCIQGIQLRPKLSSKSWLGRNPELNWGDELFLGGPETVRGLAEQSISARGYVLLSLEAGLRPAQYFGAFGFIDLAYYQRFLPENDKRTWRRLAAYGLGLETYNYLGRTRLEIGWPEQATAGDGVIYLRWLRGW
jgi:outer membrane protein assembly factor BamA